jgi:hypothetical protein
MAVEIKFTVDSPQETGVLKGKRAKIALHK